MTFKPRVRRIRKFLSKVGKVLSLLSPRKRYGAVYLITVRWNGRTRNGWIGQSRNPARRWAWHDRTQPWAHLIVDRFILWEHPRVTNFGLWWREIWRIWLYLPLFNYEWNRLNPRRITKWEQARLRRASFATFRQHSQRSIPDPGYGAGRHGGPRTPLRRRPPGSPTGTRGAR